MKKIILAIILSAVINPVFASESDGVGYKHIDECTLILIETKSESDGVGKNSDSDNKKNSNTPQYLYICKSGVK